MLHNLYRRKVILLVHPVQDNIGDLTPQTGSFSESHMTLVRVEGNPGAPYMQGAILERSGTFSVIFHRRRLHIREFQSRTVIVKMIAYDTGTGRRLARCTIHANRRFGVFWYIRRI
jgi:hypothetical protein